MSLCLPVGLIVLIVLAGVIRSEYVFEWAYVPSHCLSFVALGTNRFC